MPVPSRQTFPVSLRGDAGGPLEAIGIQLTPLKIQFLVTRPLNGTSIEGRAKLGETIIRFKGQILESKHIEVAETAWVSITAKAVYDKEGQAYFYGLGTAPKPPPAPKFDLRNTLRINAAKLLQRTGKLSWQNSNHAPLVSYTFMSSVTHNNVEYDRYECRSRVMRHGEAVDQRTMVDIAKDGTIKMVG